MGDAVVANNHGRQGLVKRRNVLTGLLAVPGVASVLVFGEPAAGAPGLAAATAEYTVLIEQGASHADAVAAIGDYAERSRALGALAT